MTDKKYGVFIGRFQPLHIGHMAIIEEIMHDGLIPIILVGDSGKIDERNPLSVPQIFTILYECLGSSRECWGDNILDTPSDADWIYLIISAIDQIRNREDKIKKYLREECALYYYPKPQDIVDGKHYAELFKDYMPLKIATYPDKLGIKINSTDIRADLEGNKHFLPYASYMAMKQLQNTP